MAEFSGSTYNEQDSLNNATPPDGAPLGTLPSQSEGIWRATLGGMKRVWDRDHATVTTTGSAGIYLYTPSNTAYPTSYAQGEKFAARANFTSVGSDKMNVNSLGSCLLYKPTGTGLSLLAAGDIQAGQIFEAEVDNLLTPGTSALQIVSPLAKPTGASFNGVTLGSSGTGLTGIYFGTATAAFSGVDLSSPGPIGTATPSTGTFTLVTVTGSSVLPVNGMYRPAANTLGFATSSTLAWQIDSSQRLLNGGTAAPTLGGSVTPPQIIQGTGVAGSNAIVRYTPGVSGALMVLATSRAAIGSGAGTAVQSGDGMGAILAQGADGTNFVIGGQFGCVVDGSVSTGVVPGRFVVITANASGSTIEGLRVDKGQNNVLGNSQGGAKATNATDGWPMIPNSAGAPTGTPGTTYTGFSPIQYDTTNHKLWIYDGGWKGVVLA